MGLFGLGKKDPAAEGDRWYEKSLRSGDRELEYLHKSVSLGSKKGMMGLARFYLKYAADDAEKMQQAASLMERAEAAGAPPDDVTLGHIYDILGRKEDAAARCRRGAEQGDGWCQFKTGQNYDAGGLFEEDADKARALYEKAAEQNVAGAFGALGALYREGRGVKKDEKRAHSLFSAGAQLGDLTACGYLAWDYLHGTGGCRQDDMKAAQYAQKGVWKRGGENRCRYVMAVLRCEGRGGVPENYADGWGMFRELGWAGFEPAKAGLEECARRRLTRPDKYYLKAKAAGTREAMAEAAAEDSIMANLYFLQESADRLAAGEALTDDELRSYLKNYTRCYGNFAHPPREVLYPLLDAIAARGKELLEAKSYQWAWDLAYDTRFSDHAGCQFVLAWAFFAIEGLRDPNQVDEGIAYCRKFLDNPEAPQLADYEEMRKRINLNLSIMEIQKYGSEKKAREYRDKVRHKLNERHQRSLEIHGE